MTDTLKAPDLQEWVARYGGYNKIGWPAWDAANEAWRASRRERLAADAEESKRVPRIT
jgi:hypothetical protein